MQTWITELKQLGPQNIILAITGNKTDLEGQRKVSASIHGVSVWSMVVASGVEGDWRIVC